jgi:hypothetical protein
MPKIRTGIVALCDGVYKDEATNKMVLSGLYSGDIISNGSDQDLRFALYVELFLPDDQEHEVDLQFWRGGKHTGGGKAMVSQSETDVPHSILVPQFSLAGPLPATFELKVALDGAKPSAILRKALLPRADPTASPPPSARSRNAPRAKASKP